MECFLRIHLFWNDLLIFDYGQGISAPNRISLTVNVLILINGTFGLGPGHKSTIRSKFLKTEFHYRKTILKQFNNQEINLK